MKYVYIVTRVVTNETGPGVAIPNLGIHTSLKKALVHYNSIVEDRVQRGYKILWDHSTPEDWRHERAVRTRECMIEQPTCLENLIIERWPI